MSDSETENIPLINMQHPLDHERSLASGEYGTFIESDDDKASNLDNLLEDPLISMQSHEFSNRNNIDNNHLLATPRMDENRSNLSQATDNLLLMKHKEQIRDKMKQQNGNKYNQSNRNRNASDGGTPVTNGSNQAQQLAAGYKIVRSDSIRTDRHTGSRYRQTRSMSKAPIDAFMDYEKEVFNSTNIYGFRGRSDSNLSQSRKLNLPVPIAAGGNTSAASKISEDRLVGYSWLGKSTSWKDQVLEAAANVWHNQAIALFILALSVTIFAFIVSELVLYCWQLIDYVYFDKQVSTFIVLIASIGLKLAFVFIAIFLTVFVAPQAAGSGIPELKAILSGIWIRRYLSIRVFCAKSLAIVCALGSGLPIGIEGPFVHIAAIIGRQLTKFAWFKHIDRKVLLSAACACSVAVIFEAPIGGVLFSIEVTHHYYKINSYWSAFMCAVTAGLFTAIVSEIAPTTLLLFRTDFENSPYKTYEFIVFGALGLFQGLLGALYVKLFGMFLKYRSEKLQYISYGFWNNAYILAFVVTSTYVFLSFILGDFAFRPIRMAIHDLFNADSLSDCGNEGKDCIYHDWGKNGGVFINLLFFSILNYIWSILFLGLDWPCGCFASVFAIGAASGRLMGELLNIALTDASGASLLAATYAVVGAASLVSGVTRTFSVAVIVIEMTAQVKLAIPVLLGVTIAWTIANRFSASLYDVILELRGVPLLPVEPKHPTNLKAKPHPRPYIASDVMCSDNITYLHAKSSMRDVAIRLEQCDDVFLPILQGNHLIGEVSRSVLEECLKSNGFERGTNERKKLLHGLYQNNQNKIKLNLNNLNNIKNGNNGILEAIREEKDENNISLRGSASGSGAIYERLVGKGSDYGSDDEMKLTEKDSEICFIDDEWIEHLNLSPVQVIPHMPLTNIYVLFHVMHPDKIYVTRKNELIGVIDEGTLIARERNLIHDANDG